MNGLTPPGRASAMQKRPRVLAGAATALALTVLLSACGGSTQSGAHPSEAAPVDGGTLTVGLATDTSIIDPSITGSSITAVIARNVVDSLVGQAEDNSFTPWLAEKWEVNSDNTEYTFHLRSGVTFSDGTSLDAAAVKTNFDRILDPKTSSSYARSLLGPVKEVSAPDAKTVTITYGKPFAPLLQGLSLPYLGIQSPQYLKGAADTKNTVVGSGPFILKSFVKGSGSELTKRSDYNWGPGYAKHTGAARLDSISFKLLPEASVRLGALTSGQVQAIDEVPPANFQSVKANDKLQVITKENPGVNRSFFLNTSSGPFTDVKVRQAFQSAADVKSAVNAAYLGSLKAADNILGPSTLYYDSSVAGSWGFDKKKAAQLLDDAGWSTKDSDGIRTKAGQRLTLRYVYDTASTSAPDLTLAQAIQAQVKEVGFDLKLDPVDAGGYTERTKANSYEIAAFYYVRAEPDILRTVFHSAYIPPNGADVSRVNSLDEKLNTALGATGGDRQKLYSDVQKEIISQAYALPQYVAAYQLGASKKLQGISWATNAKPLFYDAWLSK
ncbi:ABC transporter substrate-binding protein [Arthrobacter sp. MMS24-S77]